MSDKVAHGYGLRRQPRKAPPTPKSRRGGRRCHSGRPRGTPNKSTKQHKQRIKAAVVAHTPQANAKRVRSAAKNREKNATLQLALEYREAHNLAADL